MKKVKVTQVLNVPGGLVGLNENQARRRMHNIEEVEKQPKGLDKDFMAYSVVNSVQFKVGEELYLESIPKMTNPFVEEDGDDSDEDKNKKKTSKKTSKKK